ncbi:MAG: glycine zipper 2TM domain-containing protein [Steroidobacteraceae bacterium]
MSWLPFVLAAFAVAGCGKKAESEDPAAVDPAVQAQIDQDTELNTREEELARREAELALQEKEQDLARREAALAKGGSSSSPSPKPKAKPPASPAPAPAPTPVAAGPKSYTVPAGTSISVQLPAEITTKTARVGDRLTANLTSDLVVDGKVIAKAGAPMQGEVTQVISGSKTVGGKPTLGLTFDNLTFADGGDRPVTGRITQIAEKSDRARDTAKIAGGAIAGGVVGHQVDSDKGKVIGAILGAAAGTAAAKRTGKEVILPAGTVIGITLDSPVTVEM